MQDNNNQLEENDLIQHAHEWLNNHGHPSFSYLKKLAEDGTIESRDQLLEIADLYNVQYDRSTTTDELVERIQLFMSLGQESS